MSAADALSFDHFTSIAPVGIEAQVDKLATWHHAHGRPVFTVNHAREFDSFAGVLPPWIVPVEVDFERAYGRDYLPLRALHGGISRAAHPRHEHIVFTNSDIKVRGRDDVAALLASGADLTFASRNDVAPDGTERGVYTDGFDVFAFRRSALGVLDRDDLRLGMPWWDYMVPLFAILAGHAVRRLDDGVFPHVTHTQRWSEVAYQDIGTRCLLDMAPDLIDEADITGARITTFARFTNDILNSETLGEPGGSLTGDLRADIRRGIRNIFRDPEDDGERAEYRPSRELIGPNADGTGVEFAAKAPATLEPVGTAWQLSRNGAPYGGVGRIMADVKRGGRYEVELTVSAVGKKLNVTIFGVRTTLDRPQVFRKSVFAPRETLTIALDPAEDSRGTATITGLRLRRIATA
ncbi:hypothetical protein [Acuticoccus sediminis]|uniref:hypothetical protein n=1 Tax=Acuticoccus sediminis TaxID=2184697 RepID=UPI001CFDC3C3|nr:hypothetical protein [Acuticoccus sediminis]